MTLNNIDFGNIEIVLSIINILNPVKDENNNYIFKQLNTRLFKYAVKRLVKVLVKEKVNLFWLKDYVNVFEYICNALNISAILSKLENYDEEQEEKSIIDKNNYRVAYLNSFYANFLLYQYVSIEEFEKIPFLLYDEIIGSLRRKQIYNNQSLFQVIAVSQSNEEIVNKFIQSNKEELKEIENITFDQDRFDNDLMGAIYGNK